jgi:hypothetical protein
MRVPFEVALESGKVRERQYKAQNGTGINWGGYTKICAANFYVLDPTANTPRLSGRR